MERAALQPDRPGFLAEPAVVARCDHRDRRGEQAPRGHGRVRGTANPRCLRANQLPCHQSPPAAQDRRSEAHTSELQSLMRLSYAVFCLKKKTTKTIQTHEWSH